ncbi:MAG: 4'-phosphopantetheinyl transferase superfamily protein [Propionibacteriaceae bacterium]|nr:4'-phosphopantetheinyl transferase superfamily protein [Propionibacteriaceae bacterium]
MIDQVLPGDVCVAEIWTGDDDATAADRLWPDEERLLAGAGQRRLVEFASGRRLARQALLALGITPDAIPIGPDGGPVWPVGVIGSITHCPGYRAAVVARSGEQVDDMSAKTGAIEAEGRLAGPPLAIGIDAEPVGALSQRIVSYIANPSEIDWLARLKVTQPRLDGDHLLFSIKEAIYKAWRPLTGQPLAFHQATVELGEMDFSKTTVESEEVPSAQSNHLPLAKTAVEPGEMGHRGASGGNSALITGSFSFTVEAELAPLLAGIDWRGRWLLADGLIIVGLLGRGSQPAP